MIFLPSYVELWSRYIDHQAMRIFNTAGYYVPWIKSHQENSTSVKTMTIWLVQFSLWKSTEGLKSYFQEEELSLIARIQVVSILFLSFSLIRRCMQVCLPILSSTKHEIGKLFHSAESVQQPFREAIRPLRDDVEQLTKRLQNFDEFIRSHPELYTRISAILRQEPETVSLQTGFPIPKGSLNNPIVEWRCLHELQLSLEHEVIQRRRFLNYHPEIAFAIWECLQREERKSCHPFERNENKNPPLFSI